MRERKPMSDNMRLVSLGSEKVQARRVVPTRSSRMRPLRVLKRRRKKPTGHRFWVS